jgi:hypothetical protein
MHRRLLITSLILASLVMILPGIPIEASQPAQTPLPTLEGSFVPDEILIGLKQGIHVDSLSHKVSARLFGNTTLDEINRRHQVRKISALFSELEAFDGLAERHGLGDIYKLSFPPGTDIFAAISEYRGDPAVAYAEPNRIYKVNEIPNDTDFSKQWALNNTGQTGGTVDADIDAPEAWNIQKGQASVLIAIVDTGVDYNHPELYGGRVRTDIDKDFINNDDDAMDDHGHGTFCSGIAAANTNNTRGIAGVCPGCQILPVKVLDSEGSGTAESVSKGIQYAAQANAKIISMSLGYASECGCSQTVARVINYAFEKGSLLVAASGNDSTKNMMSYPASSPRVLSVGASDYKDVETDFSNRSPKLDIMAPGKDIYSLDKDGRYRTASGTSAAAPHVSGAAGLVWSARPHLSNTQAWWVLYQTADNVRVWGTASTDFPQPATSENREYLPPMTRVFVPTTNKSRITFGRLNAYKALRITYISQVTALEDTCSQEPDCPPGCGAEITLAGDESSRIDLSLLRKFRDDVLRKTSPGEAWIDLYQRHRLESALILVRDQPFRLQTQQALVGWLPLFEALVSPDKFPPGTAIITARHVQYLESVMEGLTNRGSPQLASDLAQVQVDLQAKRFIGWDIRQAWAEFK